MIVYIWKLLIHLHAIFSHTCKTNNKNVFNIKDHASRTTMLCKTTSIQCKIYCADFPLYYNNIWKFLFKSCFVTPMQSCSKSTDHHELATTANHSQASQCYLQATRQGYLPLDKKKNIWLLNQACMCVNVFDTYKILWNIHSE